MKIFILFLSLTFMALPMVSMADSSINLSLNGHSCNFDDISLDVDDGSVFLTHKSRHHKGQDIEITEDYELYVNGDRVKTSDEQKELLKEYHDLACEMSEYGAKIGIEGAKIGIQGAGIGLQALVGVVKLLSPTYDEEDLDADLEYAAEKLEKRAKALEEKAEKLEDMVDDLDYMNDELSDKIPAIAELGWF